MSDESEEAERKERVLHTRVPAVLEQELKRLAASWRVPVSNVVRTILEDALTTVEVVGRKAEGELHGIADRLASERLRLRGRKRDAEADEGWQGAETADSPREDLLATAVGLTPLVLLGPAICAITGQPLCAGEEAYLAVFAEPGRPKVVSARAVSSRTAASDPAVPGQSPEPTPQEE